MSKSHAARHCPLASNQGHAAAQCDYGFLVEIGDGIPIDKSLAAHYYKLSTDQGDGSAQFNSGVCLPRGNGPPIDRLPTSLFFQSAADQGHPGARIHSNAVAEAISGQYISQQNTETIRFNITNDVVYDQEDEQRKLCISTVTVECNNQYYQSNSTLWESQNTLHQEDQRQREGERLQLLSKRKL
jgi:hypothetical protein